MANQAWFMGGLAYERVTLGLADRLARMICLEPCRFCIVFPTV
jgi:hypothetical protein